MLLIGWTLTMLSPWHYSDIDVHRAMPKKICTVEVWDEYIKLRLPFLLVQYILTFIFNLPTHHLDTYLHLSSL